MMLIILTIISIIITLLLFSINKSIDTLNLQIDQIFEIAKKLENYKDLKEKI